jgi:tRNA pseudouridine65 synthase
LNLEVIYQDEEVVVVNKPHGLLTHSSNLAKDAETSALFELKNQLQQFLFTVHRLDRKTSGVLIFALNKTCQSRLSQMFREGRVSKTYHAIVRGFTAPQATIDYPIKDLKSVIKEAISHYRTIEKFELPFQTGIHTTSRYALVELIPETGRYHQLRMHMAHDMHPIIGDRPHGCNKQNRFFKTHFKMDTMLLHAQKIEFAHPTTQEPLVLEAPYSETFEMMLNMMRRDNLV